MSCLSPVRRLWTALFPLILLVLAIMLGGSIRAQAGDNAAYLLESVPTAMQAGQTYSVSVTMQNNGTTTWLTGNNFHLGPQNPQDNQTWGSAAFRIDPMKNIAPGAQVTFAFLVTAPSTAGTYNFQYKMVHDGVAWFGGLSTNVAVVVSAPTAPTRPQVAPGGSAGFAAASYTDMAFAGTHTWAIYNTAYQTVDTGSGSGGKGKNGWIVTYGNGFGVTAPTSAVAPASNYTVEYGEKTTQSGGEPATLGYSAAFDVISTAAVAAARVTCPTGTPYPWQSSVGGVNTANGNKMVMLPLVGWTARGGMPVGISLSWNSLAPGNYNPSTAYIVAPKWTFNYETFMTVSGSGTGSLVTIWWGDGRSYSFTKNSAGTFVPPVGIYDTLTSDGTSYDLRTKDQTVYKFTYWSGGSGAHYLTSIVDKNTNTITLTRTGGANRVTTVTDPSNRTLSLGYDSLARLYTVVDNQTGRAWVLNYASASAGANLSSVSWPVLNGSTPSISFTYDGGQNIHTCTDLDGHYAWGANYNNGSTLGNESDGCGNSTSFTYNGTTVVTDPNGHATTFTFAGGLLSAVTDALNDTESYLYDGNNNVVQKTDKNGNVWSYLVNSSTGNGTGTNTPLQEDSTQLDDSRTSVPLQSVDPSGAKTTNVYDASGFNLLSTTDGNGNTTTINSYSSYGLPTSMTDALGNTSGISYDAYGDVTQTQDPNGNTNTATYNGAGWLMTSTDGLGDTTGYFTDTWGRVVAVNTPPTTYSPLYRLEHIDSGGGYHTFLTSSQSEYNTDLSNGSGWYPIGPVGGVLPYVSGQAQPAGTVPLYRTQENGAGDGDYATSAAGYNTLLSYGYTGYGIIGYVFSSAAPGRKPIYYAYNPGVQDFYTDNAAEYNALGAPWHKQGVSFYVLNNTTSTTYDNNGNVLSVTDSDGNTTTNTYDNDNRLLTTTKANGDEVTYTYDSGSAGSEKGLLTFKTTGNGAVYGYAYTPRNELAQIGYPDKTSEFYSYDANGNLQTHTRRDNTVVKYAYDADSRPTTTTYPNTSIDPNVTFGYNLAARQSTMQDALGTTTWTYDAGGRLSTEADVRTSLSQTMTYGYDADNRKTSISWSGGPGAWSYAYDPAGRLMSEENPLSQTTGFVYDNADRLVQKQLADGFDQAYGYDAAGDCLSMYWGSSNNPTSIGWDAYGYDPAGVLVANSCNDGSFTSYGYDAAYQLTGAARTGPWAYTGTTTYDHNGNRLTQTLNGQTDNYSYQPSAYTSGVHTDELLQVSGSISGTKTFSYDANGNVRSENANGNILTFNTDYEDKPLSITGTTPWGAAVNDVYAYNGLGMRKTGTNIAVLTDGETPGSPILVNGSTTYTPGISVSGGGNGGLFYLTDGRDTMRARINISGTIEDDVRYDPWGNLLEHGGASPSSMLQGFGIDAAYSQDADTGLTLMGNRYYDPTIGRFLSQDPSGDGDNWYEYADNDPLAEEDPTGLVDTPVPNVASIGGGDAWIGGIMSGSGYEGEGGGASFDLYLTRWDWKKGQYSATWSVPIWGEEFDAGEDTPPNGVPSDWKQIPHGPDARSGGMTGNEGETRWINPAGTEGLEHHPGRPGNHDGDEHTHPMEPKPNNKGWKYTNPKQTIIVGAAAVGAVAAWEIIKWTAAAVAAPETLGGSLILAGATP